MVLRGAAAVQGAVQVPAQQHDMRYPFGMAHRIGDGDGGAAADAQQGDLGLA